MFDFTIGKSTYTIYDTKDVAEEAYHLLHQAIANGTCSAQIIAGESGSLSPIWWNNSLGFSRFQQFAINKFAEDCIIRLIFALKNIALPQEFITSPLGLSIIAIIFASICIGLSLYGCIRKYNLNDAPVLEAEILEDIHAIAGAVLNPALQGAFAPAPIIPDEEEQEDLEMQAIADPQPPAAPNEEEQEDPEEAAALHPPAQP